MISSQIIENCIRKERQAYKLCYEACAPYIYTIVKSYIFDEEFRRDAMQEIFAQIFSSIKNYDADKGSFKSWIAKIGVNQCISILRKSQKLNLFVPLDGNDKTSTLTNDESQILTSREDLLELLKICP